MSARLVTNRLIANCFRWLQMSAWALEENITFVKSQIELYKATLFDSTEQLNDYRARYQAASGELTERQLEMRGLKQALVQPSSSPSRAIIEEMVRKQSFLDRLGSIQQTVDGLVDELRSIAVEWTVLQDRLKRLSRDDLTDTDLARSLLSKSLFEDIWPCMVSNRFNK